MAVYKYAQYLVQSHHSAFDTIVQPGQKSPYAGIYRCEGCGENIVSPHGQTMPTQHHFEHTRAQGGILWRLIVSTR